jgi:hypothetical protein
VPRGLLQHAQNITTLMINMPPNEHGVPGYICTVTKDDIVQLRSLCQELQELWVDVVYCSESLTATNDQLANLAQIEHLELLKIFLHIKNPRSYKKELDRWDCRLMFDTTVKERKSNSLHCAAPFAVEFKLVREWDKMEGHQQIPDYEF